MATIDKKIASFYASPMGGSYTPNTARVKRENKKKCKSCKLFSKGNGCEVYRFASPNRIACGRYEKRKR